MPRNAMTVEPLPYDFHDGGLLEVKLGPRREVTLTVGLALPGRMGDHMVDARFGGITNFEDVRAFFKRIPVRPAPDVFVDRIDGLDYDEAEVSRVNGLILRLQLEWHGQIVIRCRNIAVRPRGPWK